jgi:MFS family permease
MSGTTVTHPAALHRARWGLTAVFTMDGMVFASWSSRLPQVQHTVHAGNGALGTALLGTAVGAFTAMPLTGLLCRSLPPRRVAPVALALLCGAVLLPGLARSPATLLPCLVVFGAAYGAVDVSMNATAVQLAAQLRRPIVPAFHAAFSLGSLAGAAGGSAAAGAGLSVEAHMVAAAVTLAAAAGSAVVLRHVPEADRRTRGAPGRRLARTALPFVVVACVLTFGTAFGEGSVAGWAAVHLRQGAAVFRTADDLWEHADAFGLVVVSVPTRHHTRIAARAIDAGLAVVVDKPFTATAAEAAALTERAAARGTLLSVFHTRRWDGDFRTVRELVAGGRVGAVHRFESRFERWRPEVKASGGRAGAQGGGRG